MNYTHRNDEAGTLEVCEDGDRRVSERVVYERKRTNLRAAYAKAYADAENMDSEANVFRAGFLAALNALYPKGCENDPI